MSGREYFRRPMKRVCDHVKSQEAALGNGGLRAIIQLKAARPSVWSRVSVHDGWDSRPPVFDTPLRGADSLQATQTKRRPPPR